MPPLSPCGKKKAEHCGCQSLPSSGKQQVHANASCSRSSPHLVEVHSGALCMLCMSVHARGRKEISRKSWDCYCFSPVCGYLSCFHSIGCDMLLNSRRWGRGLQLILLLHLVNKKHARLFAKPIPARGRPEVQILLRRCNIHTSLTRRSWCWSGEKRLSSSSALGTQEIYFFLH